MNSTTNANSAADRLRRLYAARLYVLTDGAKSLVKFTQTVSILISSGVDIIQLREKRLSDDEVGGRLEQANKILRAANSSTLFIINDRVELAAEYPVDGVHVGQDDTSPVEARSIIGSEKLLGLSTHSLEQARLAVSDGVDYIGAGPTFPSRTKSFDTCPGLEFLTQVSDFRLPVFAIGGIKANNIDSVLATGISRVAVNKSVVGAKDIHKAVAKLRAKLDAAAVA